VSDVDTGALTGIAVTAVVNTNGAWQYSTNGGTSWTAFGIPSANNARLLAANVNTRVRFVPLTGYFGPVNNGITFRAWDQSTGTAGNTANTSTNGGTTAFSATTASASILVNRPPTAGDDFYSDTEGQSLPVTAGAGVLSNDSDPDLDSITAVLVSGPAHASSFTLNADGSFFTCTTEARRRATASSTASMTDEAVLRMRPFTSRSIR
jgi:hypothetical protein